MIELIIQDMKDLLSKLQQFNESFDIPYQTKPCNISKEDANLRFSLMFEETQEYHCAAMDNDVIGIADALGDKLYILLGTIIAHGMQDIIVDVFNEIHDSNMSKLDLDGKAKRRADGKIMKGPKYRKPNLEQFINK
jgi:predicted HAD superfamily Cof-like phosphohydrolase